MTAAYDLHADWYAEYIRGPAAAHTARTSAALGRMIGPGEGRCLDVGCGNGIHAPLLRSLGWTAVGVDVSLAQLRHARRHLPVAVADAERLPFAADTFDAVVATLIHTDVADWAATVGEMVRVLRPGGRFGYVGVHPCFVGPFAARTPQTLTVHPGYEERTLTYQGPGIGRGIRPRVGVRHRTLADLLNPLLAAGLTLQRIEEAGVEPAPDLLAVAAVKPASRA